MTISESPQVAKKGAPSWAAQPFRDLMERTEKLQQLLHLSIRGISVLRAMPRLVEALQKVSPSEEKIDLETARREAKLAQSEVDSEFPLLHAQYVVAIWASLETAMYLFLANWLQNQPEALTVEPLRRLKVKVGEYESLDAFEKALYLVDRLEQETAASLKPGIGRFEALLQPFGLSGKIHEEDVRALIELGEIRNCIVHRAGIVDRRLLAACPWLNLTFGQQLQLDHEKTQMLSAAVMSYATEIIVRFGEHFGSDMSGVSCRSRNGG
jgi:hypothetical protein